MEVPSIAASAPLDEIMAIMREHGAVILLDCVALEVCDQVVAELKPYVEHTNVGFEGFSGTRTQRCGSIVARSPSARALWANETVMQVCDRVLGHQDLPGRSLEAWGGAAATNTGGMKYQLSMTCANVISPGETRQFIHHDKSHYTYTLPEELEPELATIWALQDFTEENGATLVVPGSHAWEPQERDKLFGTNLGAESPLVTTAVMPKGACLAYSSSTLHAGGDNVSSDDVRWGLRLAYNLAFLRQEENQFVSVPPEVARELPDALQALLGYDTLGALGYVEGGKHPKAVLDAGWNPGSETGWDPREVESAARLNGPDWVMTGGPQPPLFPETEEQTAARKKRTQAMMAAMAKMRAAAAAGAEKPSSSAKL
jgi:hypothetical protein